MQQGATPSDDHDEKRRPEVHEQDDGSRESENDRDRIAREERAAVEGCVHDEDEVDAHESVQHLDSLQHAQPLGVIVEHDVSGRSLVALGQQTAARQLETAVIVHVVRGHEVAREDRGRAKDHGQIQRQTDARGPELHGVSVEHGGDHAQEEQSHAAESVDPD